MNRFCKTFFTIYFVATAAAMVLLSFGFASHASTLMGLF